MLLLVRLLAEAFWSPRGSTWLKDILSRLEENYFLLIVIADCASWLLLIEYLGLALVFFAYGGIYLFGWGVLIAAILYLLDHLFFALALAIKTYFQKIADPRDIAATAAVAFTINHIAAIFLPVVLGFLWLASPFLVFCAAGILAVFSFVLALLIPGEPRIGKETIFCVS